MILQKLVFLTDMRMRRTLNSAYYLAIVDYDSEFLFRNLYDDFSLWAAVFWLELIEGV